MASFFDLKARKAAAANGASSSSEKKTTENAKLQPWVEK
jgi:replication factor C subunit 2/4